jgi:uncharacterized protein DUF2625
MRQLHELVEVDDPAWPEIASAIAGGRRVQAWPSGEPVRSACLSHLQVTVRSALGAFVWHCGGMLVADGWLRVYGSPGAELGLPSLAGVNGFPGTLEPRWRPGSSLVVAHDVLGGTFAVNGDDPAGEGRPGSPGEVVYFAPDSLAWEVLGMGHGVWLDWLLTDRLDEFYADLRWPGWEQEVAGLPAWSGLSVMPFLWSAEAQEDLAAASRRSAPMAELLGLHVEFCDQLGTGDPGFLGDLPPA